LAAVLVLALTRCLELAMQHITYERALKAIVQRFLNGTPRFAPGRGQRYCRI
jgi:hypothetical protein